MATYYVRPKMQLHREVEKKVKGRATKAFKLYQEGEEISDLTDAELIKYQHLIESDKQVASRQPNKKTSGT